MSEFDPSTLDWDAPPLAGWTYDQPVKVWFQGAHRTKYRIHRQCPTCGDAIVLTPTKAALEGRATNHGLALRRCKKCRQALKAGPAAYQERKDAKPAEVVKVVTDTAQVKKLEAEIESLKEQLADMDADDSARIADIHNAFIAAGYRIHADALAPEVVKLLLACGKMPADTGAKMLARLESKPAMPWEKP